MKKETKQTASETPVPTFARGHRRRLGLRVCAGLALGLATASTAVAQRPGPEPVFQGRALLVVSDTDMKASAYVDGKLGSDAGEDTLSVIEVGTTPKRMHAVTAPASNSVAGPPQSLAVSPDGKTAVVIETYGPRPVGRPDATMKDLAPGHLITVVALEKGGAPKVVQTLTSFEHPQSVSINSAGTLVAVAYGLPTTETQPALAIFRLQNGRLSEPMIPTIPGFSPQDVLTSAEFHPKEDVLALVYSTHPRLSFVRYEDSGTTLRLSAWGNDVGLDHKPFLVRFTADGRTAVVNDMYYGPDVKDVQGTLLSVAVAREHTPAGAPLHKIVSHEAAETYPEGLAISPDGRWVVTTNLEHSSEPLDSPRQGFFSSLTLFRLDDGSGQLEKVGVFPFDGILPEAAVFDNSSRMLAVTNFDRFDNAAPGGSIDFWRLVDDAANPGRTLLIRTNDSVPVARGPQSMVLVR